ncbi:MAG TPA: 3-dehydroquinate synthase [Pyrinomonadaceae bacterium]|jgi:3-dehydroquinate synthase|nr:3-dehydroquinate synthase [Pyrinomonadaceae bacterium]
MRRVRVRAGARGGYEILIGAGALDLLGEVARGALHARARKVVVVSDARVFPLYGERACGSLRAAGYEVVHWAERGGERAKTLRTAERLLEFFAARGLERTDAVVALGGGVVGDLAGFAAAIHLRGVPVVQVPTTLLAQVDSSVGGKTGVNARAGKNMIGAFHQPAAVVADTETLATLPRRELTAGWCEAIKQGAVGDRELFERTRDFLDEGNARSGARGGDADGGGRRGGDALSDLIARQCAFKARVVAADERESVERSGALSRRVLNFGHTVGHALEAVTDYRRFRHGEAVGYGMIAAAEISNRLGRLAASELELLRRTVALAGRLPPADDLEADEILRAAAADKKSTGGELQWVLLEEIGRAAIVGGRDIAPRVAREGVRAALKLGG